MPDHSEGVFMNKYLEFGVFRVLKVLRILKIEANFRHSKLQAF